MKYLEGCPDCKRERKQPRKIRAWAVIVKHSRGEGVVFPTVSSMKGVSVTRFLFGEKNRTMKDFPFYRVGQIEIQILSPKKRGKT